MSIPATDSPEVEAVEGVILKSPKVRGIVAATAGVVGLGLTAVTGAFSSLIAAHQMATMPAWVGVAYAVYGVLAPAAFGVWKANIR